MMKGQHCKSNIGSLFKYVFKSYLDYWGEIFDLCDFISRCTYVCSYYRVFVFKFSEMTMHLYLSMCLFITDDNEFCAHKALNTKVYVYQYDKFYINQ